MIKKILTAAIATVVLQGSAIAQETVKLGLIKSIRKFNMMFVQTSECEVSCPCIRIGRFL